MNPSRPHNEKFFGTIRHAMHTRSGPFWPDRVFTLEATALRRLQRLWLDIYEYYAQPISDNQLLWYSRDMESFPYVDVAAAMLTWRNQAPPEKQKPRAPLPEELKAILGPQETLDGIATSLATRMFAAVATFGRQRGTEAIMRLGPGAAEACAEMGGWGQVCQAANFTRREMFIPQTRDLIKQVMAKTGNTPQQKALAANQERVTKLLAAKNVEAKPGVQQFTSVGQTLAKLVPHG